MAPQSSCNKRGVGGLRSVGFLARFGHSDSFLRSHRRARGLPPLPIHAWHHCKTRGSEQRPGAFCWKRTPEIKRKIKTPPHRQESPRKKKMEQKHCLKTRMIMKRGVYPVSKHVLYPWDMVLFIISVRRCTNCPTFFPIFKKNFLSRNVNAFF